MNKIPFIALAILSGALCLAAPAENEALYFPNGEFYVPRANLLDNNGNTVRSYALNLRKYSGGWKFKLYGATPLSTSTNAASTNNTATNTTATTNVNVSGDWAFTFQNSFVHTFNGTSFSISSNSPPPTPDIITLTLSQNGEDVTGTGTVGSVEYTLSGQVADDLFSFSLLAGYTNSTLALMSAHVAVGTNTMGGDYFGNLNTLSSIKSGAVTATKQ